MNKKYDQAIGVATSLIKKNNSYMLSFESDYSMNLEYFTIIIKQNLYALNAPEHKITITYLGPRMDNKYSVVSDQITTLFDGDPDSPLYKGVRFNDSTKMYKYIRSLLEMYSSRY